MIHYSCDRCGKKIDPELEVRYVVRIEIQASCDSPFDGCDDDADHLLELDEILDRLDDAENGLVSDDIYHRRKHDLCSDCYREYRRNPLAIEPPVPVSFSEN